MVLCTTSSTECSEILSDTRCTSAGDSLESAGVNCKARTGPKEEVSH